MDLIAFDKQYTMKQNVYYFFATKLNLVTLILIYIYSNDFMNFVLIYPIVGIVLYKFFYKETKMDNPYKTFLYEKFIVIIRKIKLRNRKIIKEFRND